MKMIYISLCALACAAASESVADLRAEVKAAKAAGAKKKTAAVAAKKVAKSAAELRLKSAKSALREARSKGRDASVSQLSQLPIDPGAQSSSATSFSFQAKGLDDGVYVAPLYQTVGKNWACPIDTTGQTWSGFRKPFNFNDNHNDVYVFKYGRGAHLAWEQQSCAQEPYAMQPAPPVYEVLANGWSAPVFTVTAPGATAPVTGAFRGSMSTDGSLTDYYATGASRVSYCLSSTKPTGSVSGKLGYGYSGPGGKIVTLKGGRICDAIDDGKCTVDVDAIDMCAGGTVATEGMYINDEIPGAPIGLGFGPDDTYYKYSPFYYLHPKVTGGYDSIVMRDWTGYVDGTGPKATTSTAIRKYGSTNPLVFRSGDDESYDGTPYEPNYMYAGDGGGRQDFGLRIQFTCTKLGEYEERYLVVSVINWYYIDDPSFTTEMYYKLVCDLRPVVDPTNTTQVVEALAAANTTAEALEVLVVSGTAFAGPQGNRCNAACANGLPTACTASGNAGVCSKCLSVGSCSKAVGDTTTGRQAELNGILFLACPQLTRAEQTACFSQAHCDGLINREFDACTMNGVTTICPACDKSSSKKGLLGLLGLLGLIPLCLLSLCCLLLLCLRRQKKGADTHFATFDAGAPAMVSGTECFAAPTPVFGTVGPASWAH